MKAYSLKLLFCIGVIVSHLGLHLATGSSIESPDKEESFFCWERQNLIKPFLLVFFEDIMVCFCNQNTLVNYYISRYFEK